MGRESTLTWATGYIVVLLTATVNTRKGSGGGKGQLMSSVLLVMESELVSGNQ